MASITTSQRSTTQRWLRWNYNRRRDFAGLVFVLPVFVFLCIFAFYPMARAFYLSLTRYNLITPPRWIGLQHYQNLLSDKPFIKSLGVTFHYAISHSIGVWILGLALGLIFARSFRGRDAYRTFYFLPQVLSGVVVAIVWELLYHPQGVVNTLLVRPITGRPIYWLSSTASAPWAIIIMSIWQALGFYMIVFTAGVQDIPEELYDAAKVDGATSTQRFWYITLPLLRPTMLFAVVIATIGAYKTFTYQYVMTQGGPADATKVVALHIYFNAFQFLNMGKAAAMSLIMFAIIMAFTLIQLRVMRSDDFSYV